MPSGKRYFPSSWSFPYDQLNGINSLMGILTEAVKYEAEHGNYKFVRPSHLPLYDKNIANDATRQSSEFV